MGLKHLLFSLFISIVTYTGNAAPPTLPATNLTMTGTQGDAISVNYTRGNGARRMAILKMGSPVTFSPVNATSYLGRTTFGEGVEVAPGEFVVYDGAGGSFVLLGLVPATEYHIAIFEYNGTGLSAEYLTTEKLTGSGFTLSSPTVQPTNISFTEITGNGMRINWDPGDGGSRIVLMKEAAPVDANPVELVSYNAQPIYAYSIANVGSIIGSGNYVVYKGSGSGVDITNLDPSITYHVAVFEYNGSTGPVYLVTNPLRGNATTMPEPSVASSALTATTIEGDRITLRWTSGNGTRRVVLARESQPIEDLPVNGINYPRM
jgi:hypothetical protein